MGIDTGRIRHLATELTERAAEIRAEAHRVGRAVDEVPWSGLAASAMQGHAALGCAALERAAGAHDDAAEALRRHAAAVDLAVELAAELARAVAGAAETATDGVSAVAAGVGGAARDVAGAAGGVAAGVAGAAEDAAGGVLGGVGRVAGGVAGALR